MTTRRLYHNSVDALFARISQDGSGGWDLAWYLEDQLGSVRDVVDNTGAIINHIDYDGYGNITAETNPSDVDRYGWTGREFDVEIGLQYNRARYYDPTIGRWIRHS